MIVTTLLNIWLTLTGVLDPVVFSFHGEQVWPAARTRVVLKKHPPLELAAIRFASPAADREPAAHWPAMTQAWLNGLKRGATPYWEQACSQWEQSGTWCRAKALEWEIYLLQLQTEVIIRRLHGIADQQGYPRISIDPYWAHYGRYDEQGMVLVTAFESTTKSKRLTRELGKVLGGVGITWVQSPVALGNWLVHQIRDLQTTVEITTRATSDLRRHSCKPDFVQQRREWGPLVSPEAGPAEGVRVASRRCLFVD